MNNEEYHWYPYLEYQKDCKEAGKEDSIQEWLWLTGRVDTPPVKPKQEPAPEPEWKVKDAGKLARKILIKKRKTYMSEDW